MFRDLLNDDGLTRPSADLTNAHQKLRLEQMLLKVAGAGVSVGNQPPREQENEKSGERRKTDGK